MWTRNYQNLINTRSFVTYGNLRSDNATAPAFDDTTPFTFKKVNGNLYNLCVGNNYVSYGNDYSRSSFINNFTVDTVIGEGVTVSNSDSLKSTTNLFLYFGSGTAKEDFNDYKLTEIAGISSVGALSNTISKNSDGKYVCTITGIIKAENACTISEFGLFRILASFAQSGSGSWYHRALIYRKVLATPLTLTAGQTASVSFSITLPTITIVQS